LVEGKRGIWSPELPRLPATPPIGGAATPGEEHLSHVAEWGKKRERSG